MKRGLILLSVLLGLSVLVNGLTILELLRLRDEAAKPDPRPAAPADPAPAPVAKASPKQEPPSDLGLEAAVLLEEIRGLRRELIAARAAGGASIPAAPAADPGPAAPPPSKLTDALASDPALAAALQDQEAAKSFWENLNKIAGLRGSLDPTKYRELVLKLTCEYLGLNASAAQSFALEAEAAQRLKDQAEGDFRQSTPNRSQDWNDPGVVQRYQELYRQHAERVKQAMAGLTMLLDDSMRHRAFRNQIPMWIEYLDGNAAAGDYGWQDWIDPGIQPEE